MVAPAHGLYVFRGRFGPAAAPVEEWMFNIRTTAGAPLAEAAHQALARAAVDAWSAHLRPLHWSGVALTSVKHCEVAEGGKVVQDAGTGAYDQGEVEVNLPGTGAVNAVYPPHIAMCVSLQTPRPGPSGRGRIFLPPPRAGLDNDGLVLADAFQAEVVGAAAAFIRAITAIGKTVVVVSPRRSLMTAVTEVKVGRVLDTMRSRRGEMAENYKVLAVT